MERGMVKPMIRGEQQDSRSDMVSSNTLDSLDPHAYPFSPLCMDLLSSWFESVSSGLRIFQQTEQS